ncbi:MAG: HDOD domain-containing protein [Chromatiaceae bacterium]|nr:HDOD domain-containing protein [Chromatiaceae bacterium]
MTETQVEQVKLKFNRITTLPPLPRTATQLLAIIGDPEADIDQVVKILEQDPPLTARILGLANSAYFGQVREINTVREAIIRVLGMNLVKSLSLSIAMAGTFDTSACREFNLADYWYTSLGTATLARMIAQRAQLPDASIVDSVYLCGLVHKLGLLLLANLFPAELSAVFTEHRQNPDMELPQLERRSIGVDHMAAGEWLLSRWHLPESVISVIGFFDNSEYNGSYRFHLESIRAASSWIIADMSGTPAPLSGSDGLLGVLGLSQLECSTIEDTFIRQREELHSVSRLLDRRY